MNYAHCREVTRIAAGLLIALCLLVAVVSCARRPAPEALSLGPPHISARTEAALGRLLLQRLIQKRGGIYPDPELSLYINTVGERLVGQTLPAELKFTFSIVNDTDLHAYALPGGHVVISRGFLLQLASEDELVSALSHEVGHIMARHNLLEISLDVAQQEEIAAIDRVGQSPDRFLDDRTLAGIFDQLINKRYTPAQEEEALRLGDDIMMRSGYIHQSPGLSADAELFQRAFETLTRAGQGYMTFARAQNLERQEQLGEAISLYHQALLETPDDPLIMCRLGLAYLRNEDLVPARRYLIKSVNLNNEYYQSRLGIGYVYLKKQEYDKALNQLEAGVTLLPTLEGAYMLAEAREHTGDLPGALTLYRAVVKTDRFGKLGHNAAGRIRVLEQK